MKLYDMPASGNCYKVRLLLALLGVGYESVPVDLAAGRQKTPAFLAMNPLGKIPVLDDGGHVVWDSQAILVYLGRKHGRPDWWPDDADGQGEVMQWLSFSANEMLDGPAAARAILEFGRRGDLNGAQEKARLALGVLDEHLAANAWLALDRPTIADIACYPYAGLVGEGEVSLEPYPSVRAWFARIEALPGHVGMPGLGG